MPWLTVHMTLPLAIMGASVIGAGIERVEAALRSGALSRRAVALVAGGITSVCAAWFLFWGWGSAGPWVTQDNQLIRTLRPTIADNPWLLYLPVVALVALSVIAITLFGARYSVPVIGLSLIAIGLLGQLHVGYRMTYVEGDVPL